MPFEELILKLFFYLMPMYVSNASAMLLGGGKRLDLNAEFMRQPLLGKGKTIQGTVSGITMGVITAFILNYFFAGHTKILTADYLTLGILLSVGAVSGDIAAAFIKRRLKMKPGAQFFPLDQLDFVFGGMIIGSIILIPSITEIILSIIITLFIHRAANFIAFKTRIKRVPW